MRIEREKHAPGTVLLTEISGNVHEAVIVGWSPLGQAVKLMVGQSQQWFIAQKTHAVEFLRVSTWEEFEELMKEAERKRTETREADPQEIN